jgi:hypothetical protein
MTLSTRSIVAPALVAVLALVPAAVSAQQQSRGTSRSSGPAALGIHGFSVVLVVGSLSGTTAASSESVPDAAKKALADMKDFLPYKRYQLLDAAWMLCCASPRAGVSGRVRGPDEREYRYEVDPIGVSETKLDVRFTIRDVTPSAPARRSNVSEALTADHPRMVQARREASEAHGTSGQNVIDSTFSISLGETVVVGTSRLHGDRALIAILTAAAKPATANR